MSVASRLNTLEKLYDCLKNEAPEILVDPGSGGKSGEADKEDVGDIGEVGIIVFDLYCFDLDSHTIIYINEKEACFRNQ